MKKISLENKRGHRSKSISNTTWDEIIKKVKKGEWRLLHIDQLSSDQLIEIMLTGSAKLTKKPEVSPSKMGS